MNITFNYFKHKFEGKTKFRDLTKVEMDFVKANFPEDLYAFLSEEGYCSYGNGFFHFIDPQEHQDMLAKWKVVPEGHLLFFRTGMGDLITYHSGSIYILHVYDNILSHISDEMFDFFKFSLGDEQYVNKTLYKTVFDKTRSKHGDLLQDETYSFTPVPVSESSEVNKSKFLPTLEWLAALY